VLLGVTLTYKRFDDFISVTTGRHITPGEIVQVVEPAPGTIAYKLKHGQPVSILLLGMGGEQNDSPYLTDSIMAVTMDPASGRVMLLSIPRDLVVRMNLQNPPTRTWTNKINAAFEVAHIDIICCVAPEYKGRDGGGHAAEHEVSKVTGLTFDRYIGVDFVAFRDMVNALGGVDICLSTNLDDDKYPDYTNGYWKGGIHYKAGCHHADGEVALQIARSRHAVQAEQSSDFGRAKRQQDIMQAIKKKATTVNGFAKAPRLLDALQKNIDTDMTLSDMKAIYDWGKNLPDSSIIRTALTAPSPAGQGNLLDSFNCGMGPNVSQLCPDDPTYTMIKKYIASIFIDRKILAEKAPIQFASGAPNFVYGGLDTRVVTMFDPTGLQLLDTVAHAPVAQTQILDYSGGQYPLTTQWLQGFFGGTVVAATPTNPAPARGQQTTGIVVVLGRDFAQRFMGQ
jgi:LCP family protein required for cell wall assembly